MTTNQAMATLARTIAALQVAQALGYRPAKVGGTPEKAK